MAKYHKDDEPVPGYRLVQYLGSGGSGEVWKARGPGDVLVAIKMLSIDTERRLADREVKALTLLKNIRNPFLLPIFGMWLRDDEGHILLDADAAGAEAVAGKTTSRGPGSPTLVVDLKNYRKRSLELVIAMGLGDKTLLDRLKECPEGEGIPVEELMRYMRDAARGLDYLNAQQHDLGDGQLVAIYHCDIKPENILIVGGGVQICDFGLAKVVNPGHSSATMAGFTPDYVAPEVVVDKLPSPTSDQYSLAITYYRLRTGRSPFPEDCGLYEKLDRHRGGLLDFSGLTNADERRVVQTAANRDPTKRYSSNEEFVRRLDEALDRSKTQAVPPAGPGPGWIPHEGADLLGYTLEERLYKGRLTEVWKGRSREGLTRALIIRDVSDAPNSVSPSALRCIQGLPHERHGELWELKNYAFLDDEGRLIELTGPRTDLPAPQTLILVGRYARQNLEQRLADKLRESGSGFEPAELLPYMRDLARALDTLNNGRLITASGSQHAESSDPNAETVDLNRVMTDKRLVRIVHANLRPANFLLLKDGRVQLGNYAHVQQIEGDAQDFAPADVVWDPPYSSPEAANGRLTRWSDQYALAMCYVQLRTGKPALDTGASTQAVAQRERLPRLDLSRLSNKAERKVVARALAERPETRWPDCSTFVEALHEATTAAPKERPQPRRYVIAALLIVGLALLGWMNRGRVAELLAAFGGGGRSEETSELLRGQIVGLLDQAQLALQQDDQDQALTLLEQAEVHLAQAPASLKVDDLRQRASELRQRIEHTGNGNYDAGAVQQTLKRAASELRRGNAQAAMRQADAWRAKVRDPTVGSLAEYWLIRASALGKLGRWPEVPEALENAVKLSKQHAQDERTVTLRVLIEFRSSNWQTDANARQRLATLLEPLRTHAPYRLFNAELQECAESLARAELDVAWLSQDPAARRSALQNLTRLPLAWAANRLSLEAEAAICAKLAEADDDPAAPLQALADVEPQQWQHLDRPAAISAACRAIHAAALAAATPEALRQGYDLLRGAAQASPDLAAHEDAALRWELAAQWVRQQVESPHEPDWHEALQDLAILVQDAEVESVHPLRSAALAWAHALQVEARLNLQEDLQTLPDLVARATSEAAGDVTLGTYLAWLSARLDHARSPSPTQVIAAADRLARLHEQAEAQPVLGVAYRRLTAAPLLVDAAIRKLKVPRFADLLEELPPDELFKQTPLDGPANPFGSVSEAQQVAGWFTAVSGSAPVPEAWGDEALTLHLLALFHGANGQPDDALGTRLAEAVLRLPQQLEGRKLQDRAQWHLIVARCYAASQPRLSVQEYARAYERSCRGVRARELWEQVVARGVGVFEARLREQAATLPQEVKLAAARLYAARADLIDRDGSLAAGVNDPAQLRAAAYSEALQLVPENPSYRARRGLVRLEQVGADLDQVEQEDVVPLFAPGRDLPSEAYELRGKLRLYQAGRLSVFAARDQKEQLLTEAMRDWAEALQRIDQRSEDYPGFLVRKAYVHLYLANLRDPCRDDYKTLVRGDLEQAIACAQQATDIRLRWRQHEAFDALGNAIEDYGWLLQEYDRYQDAVEIFGQAIEAARREGLPAARSTMNRGRCAYKALLAALTPPPARTRVQDQLQTEDRWQRLALGQPLAEVARMAREDLETAALDPAAPADIKAECKIWLARLLPSLNRPDYDGAVEEWHEALRHVASEPRGPTWPLFQVEAAEFFLGYSLRLRGEPAGTGARERANALLAEAAQRAQALLDAGATANIGMPYRLRAVKVLQTVLSLDGRPGEAQALYDKLAQGLSEQDPAQQALLAEILCQQARFQLSVPSLKAAGRNTAVRALDLAAKADLPCPQTRSLAANTAFDLARELRAAATAANASAEQKLAYKTALERSAIHFHAALKDSKPEATALPRLLFAQSTLLWKAALAASTPPQQLDSRGQDLYNASRALLQEVVRSMETADLGLNDDLKNAIEATLSQMGMP